MKAKSAKDPDVQEVLLQLGKAMEIQEYDHVDEILTKYPKLVKDINTDCDMPLIMAVRTWDPENVRICKRHGSDSMIVHMCSKDAKPKNAISVAAQILGVNIDLSGRDSKEFKKHMKIYTDIITALTCDQSFKRSGKDC